MNEITPSAVDRIDPLEELRQLNTPSNREVILRALTAAKIDNADGAAIFGVSATLVQQKVRRLSDYGHENVIAGLTGSDRRITPAQVLAALDKVRRGLADVSAGLDVLGDARKLIASHETRRAENLKVVHHAILREIAHAILVRIDGGARLEETLDQQLPEFAAYQMDRWANLFEGAEHASARALEIYGSADFHGEKAQDEWLVEFIHSLGAIYQQATNKPPASPKAAGNVALDWRGPFSRFVEQLWPLTGVDGPPPSNGQIERALKSYTPH